jgi:hypothetical protein
MTGCGAEDGGALRRTQERVSGAKLRRMGAGGVVLGGAGRVRHSGGWSGEDTKYVTTRVHSSQG